MKHRTFPCPSLPISEIGLGCWQLGGSDWGSIDDAKAFAILEAATAGGIDFFDTADVYGAGRSEELIGRYLKQSSSRVCVATKLGRTSALYPNGYTEATVRAATEASLRRLGVEALDLTQLHCIPSAVLQQGAIFDWLRQLQQEGKIKRFGASVESDEQALICLEQEGLASLQIIFNVLRQKPSFHLLEEAKKRGVAIIVRLPLASGVLSGKFTPATEFPATDHRNYNRDGAVFNVGETFAGIPYEMALTLCDEIQAFLPAGFTLAQMAQRWILDHEAVTTVITGASGPQQVIDNASVADLPPLSAQLHDSLRRFYEVSVASHIRGPY
ncbi:MAG: aldo/keto reductase [Verrucomicrobia bacterium]|nr:MAG: aldo/keto reductase [Verrucomicrobiota bacterium]